MANSWHAVHLINPTCYTAARELDNAILKLNLELKLERLQERYEHVCKVLENIPIALIEKGLVAFYDANGKLLVRAAKIDDQK